MALEWWRSIPEGSHGTGTLQKRLWKAVSYTVRIRDYFNYGVCISCNRRPEHWSIADMFVYQRKQVSVHQVLIPLDTLSLHDALPI